MLLSYFLKMFKLTFLNEYGADRPRYNILVYNIKLKYCIYTQV